jgi:hypothetical protein
MSRPKKPRTAFATWHPKYGVNTYWIRPQAKVIRQEMGDYWQKVKGRGWRIVRVQVRPVNQ